MASAFRVSAFTVSFLVLLGGVAGCSSEAEDAGIVGPPPSEPVVFDASSETRADLGIAKWGFAVDSASREARFRGYGATNEVLVAVVQNDTTSETQKFTMKMSGPLASASEDIDFWLESDASGERRVMLRVNENGFVDNDAARAVLARFAADGKTSGATVGAGSLVARARPSDDNPFVARCEETTRQCQYELIDGRGAWGGYMNDCGALARVGMPLLGCGFGALATLPGGPAALFGCGAGAAAGSGAAELKCASSRGQAMEAYQKFDECQDKACPEPSGPQLEPRE